MTACILPDGRAFDDVTLALGQHRTAADGMCAMEAVAWLAGEEHSDAPACVSPVIADFVRLWNDGLPTNRDRDRLLKPLLSKMIGTRTTDDDEKVRSYLIIDWLVRTYTPTWLHVAGLGVHADVLTSMPAIADESAFINACPIIDAAWDAAGYAEWAALGYAEWAAEWAAAGAAVWDAAGDAAWATAGAAAGAAIQKADQPTIDATVTTLQTSAQDLVRQMCAVGREA